MGKARLPGGGMRKPAVRAIAPVQEPIPAYSRLCLGVGYCTRLSGVGPLVGVVGAPEADPPYKYMVMLQFVVTFM